jgi:hypothetical protein
MLVHIAGARFLAASVLERQTHGLFYAFEMRTRDAARSLSSGASFGFLDFFQKIQNHTPKRATNALFSRRFHALDANGDEF